MAGTEVKSDIPGTFYRRPAPSDPPYAEEGQSVTADTVIGTIELMKQFTEVLAGTAGILKKFMIEDGDAIDTDTPIASISIDGN